MLIRPRVLTLITTRRCTAQCDHCCVGAGPRASGVIPIPRLHGLIEEARRVPSIECVVFTGGECFLLGDHLDELVGRASGLGLRTRVVTNGYWAKSDGAAAERVAALRRYGLTEMMLSTGTFHQRFVPLERVITAARVAAQAGIVTRISVEACDQSTCDEGRVRTELADHIERGVVVLGHDPWIPDAGQRGNTVITHEQWIQAADRLDGPCPQILNVIAVSPEQQLISCCGYPLEQLPELRIGSVADKSLDDVLRSAHNHLLKIWIHVAGPRAISDFVAQYVPGYALPPAASICQSCTALQRDPIAMRTIAQHSAAIAETVIKQFIDSSGGFKALTSF